jgi:hypothetical protein
MTRPAFSTPDIPTSEAKVCLIRVVCPAPQAGIFIYLVLSHAI